MKEVGGKGGEVSFSQIRTEPVAVVGPRVKEEGRGSEREHSGEYTPRRGWFGCEEAVV